MIKLKIGEYLRNLREGAGISVDDLKQELPGDVVIAIEEGVRSPRLTEIAAYSRVCRAEFAINFHSGSYYASETAYASFQKLQEKGSVTIARYLIAEPEASLAVDSTAT